MLLRPLIAAAGLSAVANAFLVVPDTNSHEVEAFEAIPVESVALAQAQIVNLECAGCPDVFKNKKHHGKPKSNNKHHNKQHSSHLELNFSVQDSNRLMVNGFELYPNSDPFTNVLVAPQVADKNHGKHHNKHHKDSEEKKDNTKALKSHHKVRPEQFKSKAVEQQLGFSLQIHPVDETSDHGVDLLEIDLQIIEVGLVFVDGLPKVRVHLIKAPAPGNELVIAKVEQIASDNNAPISPADGSQCTTLLCKWRAFVAAQIERMKMHGCAGVLGGHGKHGHGDAAQSHHHHGQKPGHMVHHDKQHGWALLFRKLTSHIILPILVGIVAGVSVSILGMLVGTILVGLWRKFVRGQSFFPQHHCRRLTRSSHHKASQNEAAIAEEKAGLMADQDELPPPPSYEEGEPEHVERV